MHMRALIFIATAVVLTATPSFAQASRGYIEGAGGFVVSPDDTSGNVVGEVAVRIAPHLMAYGNLGKFGNIQPSELEPAVDATSTLVATADGLQVTGIARVPAWYSLGGLRYEILSRKRILPYVFGGAGVAHLTPKAEFDYSSGTLTGLTPTVGDNVTAQLISMGDFTQPTASNAFEFSLGGGAEMPVAKHWAVDAGYHFSRIQADTPLNAQGATFGLGYRF
jgi:opacity protein-like surface antigen